MNNITIELCAEDRARLDKLTAALEKLIPPTYEMKLNRDAFLQKELHIKKEAKTTAETPTEPQEAKEETTQATTTPTEESAPEPTLEAVETVEKVEPTITLEQIHQKVKQLSADAQKKATVRSIIFTYGTKVSDLKDKPEKWAEVWEKLTALEEA